MNSFDEKSLEKAELPQELLEIGEKIQKAGGKSFLVGGWVRDQLLGVFTDDLDVEVYHLELEPLLNILTKFGKPNLVGKAFGVITMTVGKIVYDFSFPRTESKSGAGHKGFDVKPDPHLTFEIASSRRDFTLNAIGYNFVARKLEDPHGGLQDLKNGILRHVSDAFSEDPLRALRAVQFAARFNFDIHPETQKLCAIQPLEELASERIFEEFKKLMLKAKKPSIGLEWLRKLELWNYFPELKALYGVEQEKEWHPEGDVWTHNNMVVDEAAIIRDEEISDEEEDAEFERLSLMLGALCHDLGKPARTVFKDGRWRSPGHDTAGEKPTLSFLKRMTRDQKLIDQVVVFVREHLRPALLYNARNEVKPSAFRRLALRVDIAKLVRVAKADHFGRTTPDAIEKRFEAGDWMLEQSKELNVLSESPKPLLSGKILMKLGMSPGPEMGKLIHESFELQLEGEIKTEEEVTEWARKRLSG